jgi:hypothetical protein
MKITKSQLRQIIREELGKGATRALLQEDMAAGMKRVADAAQAEGSQSNRTEAQHIARALFAVVEMRGGVAGLDQGDAAFLKSVLSKFVQDAGAGTARREEDVAAVDRRAGAPSVGGRVPESVPAPERE